MLNKTLPRSWQKRSSARREGADAEELSGMGLPSQLYWGHSKNFIYLLIWLFIYLVCVMHASRQLVGVNSAFAMWVLGCEIKSSWWQKPLLLSHIAGPVWILRGVKRRRRFRSAVADRKSPDHRQAARGWDRSILRETVWRFRSGPACAYNK